MAKNLKKIVVGVVLDVISWRKQKGKHLFSRSLTKPTI